MKRSVSILFLFIVCTFLISLVGCGQEESKTLPAVPGGANATGEKSAKKGGPPMPGP